MQWQMVQILFFLHESVSHIIIPLLLPISAPLYSPIRTRICSLRNLSIFSANFVRKVAKWPFEMMTSSLSQYYRSTFHVLPVGVSHALSPRASLSHFPAHAYFEFTLLWPIFGPQIRCNIDRFRAPGGIKTRWVRRTTTTIRNRRRESLRFHGVSSS